MPSCQLTQIRNDPISEQRIEETNLLTVELQVQSPENSSYNLMGEDKGLNKYYSTFTLNRPHQIRRSFDSSYFNAFWWGNSNTRRQGSEDLSSEHKDCMICAIFSISLGLNFFICRIGTKTTFWERRWMSSILDRLSLKEQGMQPFYLKIRKLRVRGV